jgi:hypothetical protein
MFGNVEFGKGHPAIRINEGLLIDPAYAFDGSDIVSILSAQVSGMLGFYL